MNLKKSLTENLGVKLIALVVSVFVWFYASGQKEVVWLKTIPIELRDVPDSLVVAGNVPSQGEISITGTKRQLILAGFKRMNIAVSLAGASPGRQRLTLSSKNVRLPGRIDSRNVRVIEPSALDFNLERMMVRRVQITLATTGALPENVVLLDGTFSITPSWTTIKGPASAVERARTVRTKPLDLSRLKESAEKGIALDLEEIGFQCQPNRVTVSVRVSEKATRVLPNVPPTVLVDSEDIKATVFPNTVSLTLQGPRSLLDTLSTGDVSVLLNLSGKAAARYRLAPEIILPPGVVLAATSVDSLTVVLVKNAGAP